MSTSRRGVGKNISGESSYDPGRSKASSIRNPVFRYLQAVMASSLFFRDNKGGVCTDELCALYCLANGINMNIASYILEHLQSQSYLDETGVIGIGGMITTLAVKLQLDFRPYDTKSWTEV